MGRKIADHLSRLFLQEDESSETEAWRDSSQDMTMLEKMNLWDRMLGVNISAPGEGEKFAGISGDEGSNGEVPLEELDAYLRTIRGSTAYEWLLANFQMEARLWHRSDSLELNKTSQWSKADEIRQTILRQLPTGRISKQRAPRVYFVTFEVAGWLPRIGRIVNPTTDGVVITTSRGHAQISTANDYVGKMWPAGGFEVLSVLRVVMETASTGTTSTPVYSGNYVFSALLFPH